MMGDRYKFTRRCEMLGLYLTEHEATVRETAAHFNISKSTVHKDIRDRLKQVNYPLYIRATKILEKNKQERHMRGGIATKNKYIKLRRETSDENAF